MWTVKGQLYCSRLDTPYPEHFEAKDITRRRPKTKRNGKYIARRRTENMERRRCVE